MYCMSCTNRLDKCRCAEDALNEAPPEIAHLQAELEELRESLRLAVKSADLADAAIVTAWNDAIEAAAGELEGWGDIYGNNAAASIRVLKRT